MQMVVISVLTLLALCFAGIHMTVAAQNISRPRLVPDTSIYLGQGNKIIVTGTIEKIARDSFMVDANGVEIEIFTSDLETPVRYMTFLSPDTPVRIEGTLSQNAFGKSYIEADQIFVLQSGPEQNERLPTEIAPAAGQ